MRRSTFVKGSSTFICSCCGHNTRWTGEQGTDSKLCVACWDLAGLENMLSDEGEEQFAKSGAYEVVSIFNEIKKRSEIEYAKALKNCPTLAPYVVEVTPQVVPTRKTKYTYPAGMTSAQKKIFRAKERRAR